MAEIDWNTELRKIEREFSGLPPEPTPSELRAQRVAEQRSHLRKAERTASLGAWARLSLVGVLGVALGFWPYPRDCGFGLFAFLWAEALIVVGGIWVAAHTWRLRMPRVHLLACVVVLTGLGLLEVQVLPRMGYVKAGATAPAGWMCSLRRNAPAIPSP